MISHACPYMFYFNFEQKEASAAGSMAPQIHTGSENIAIYYP
jgi:hypothetical protein